MGGTWKKKLLPNAAKLTKILMIMIKKKNNTRIGNKKKEKKSSNDKKYSVKTLDTQRDKQQS